MQRSQGITIMGDMSDSTQYDMTLTGGEGCVPWVLDVVNQVVNGALAGGQVLGDEPNECKHGQAAVLDLAQLVLLPGVGVPVCDRSHNQNGSGEIRSHCASRNQAAELWS
jgi:hypothetical protein